MHLRHNDLIRSLFRIEKNADRVSKKVIKIVERAEERMVRFHGRFLEMPYDVIVALLKDVTDEAGIERAEVEQEPDKE